MKETRDDIIQLADDFIRTRGYNAFSFADIAQIMDIKRPAIHYHFPLKEDLGISVIEKELESMWRLKRETDHLPGDQQLKSLVEVFFNRSRRNTMCLTGSLTPDYATLPYTLQQRVREMVSKMLDWMAACLEKGRAGGNLHFEGAAKDRALLVLSGLLSSLLLSRVLGYEVFDDMIGRLLKDIGATFQVAELREEPPPLLNT